MVGRDPAPAAGRHRRPDSADAVAVLFEPRLLTRLRVRLRRAALDRAIAAGADLAASPLLAARAAQLVDARHRVELAGALEHAALVVQDGRSQLRTVPRRQALCRNRERILELAAILRSGRPAYARGVAAVELILTDGAGPAYTDPCGETLARQLQIARERMIG